MGQTWGLQSRQDLEHSWKENVWAVPQRSHRTSESEVMVEWSKWSLCGERRAVCEKDGTATVTEQEQGRSLFHLASQLPMAALVRLLGQPGKGERGLSPSTCFSPFDLLYPAPMVHGWDRGCNSLCGHHRTARQLLPALGTPTASFTYTVYHGQLSYCASGTPSDDHPDCSEYHGIHGFLPFSS